MTDQNSNVSIREADKFKGLSNYYVWRLKLRAILRGESLWAFTEEEIRPEVYPVTIDGEQYTQIQLKKKKAATCKILTMVVVDDLVDTVAAHTDPALAWRALKNAFHSGDQGQVLGLISQLTTMRLAEGVPVEDYHKRARELRNKLISMEETVTDITLCQLTLNGLPRSFESTIQTITHQNIVLTFDQILASLFTETHRRESRTLQLGDDEALAVTYNQRNFAIHPGGGYSTFRGRG